MRAFCLISLLVLAACGRPEPQPSTCAPGTAWGESCTSCGPTDACLKLETGCYPTCSGACDGGVPCVGGLCRLVCG